MKRDVALSLGVVAEIAYIGILGELRDMILNAVRIRPLRTMQKYAISRFGSHSSRRYSGNQRGKVGLGRD